MEGREQYASSHTANAGGRPGSQGAWDSGVTKLPPTWIPPSAMGAQKPHGHADTMVCASTVRCLQLQLRSVSALGKLEMEGPQRVFNERSYQQKRARNI